MTTLATLTPNPVLDRVRVDAAGCWLWEGQIEHHGYGRVYIDGRHQYAHRVSYEAVFGPIADGLQIDHLCRVRNCVNPAHLDAVTAKENVRRASGTSGDTCARGHRWTPANTKLIATGRRCRACLRVAWNRANARRRGQK